MCFGGGGDAPRRPETRRAPTPSPRPTTSSAESSVAGKRESRRRRTRGYRSGFASTQLTGAQGVDDDNKETLGS